MKLNKITFEFSGGYSVTWVPEGKGKIGGRTYSFVYVVTINSPTHICTFRSSGLANKSNSLLFIKSFIKKG